MDDGRLDVVEELLHVVPDQPDQPQQDDHILTAMEIKQEGKTLPLLRYMVNFEQFRALVTNNGTRK